VESAFIHESIDFLQSVKYDREQRKKGGNLPLMRDMQGKERIDVIMKREGFQSRLGFLLVSAGCAVGIGNVWKFPYVTGANGGGVFVLFYLLFLIIMGVPVLTMELAVGRASRKSAVLGYRTLEPAGSKWHIHGWFCVAGCCLLMMYYTTVSGWMLGYFFKFAAGSFTGLAGDAVDGVFFNMQGSAGEMSAWMVITVLAGFLVCSFGLQKGLERITKVMMIGLLGLISVLAVHSLMLPGGMEGVKFYLLPDFGRAMKAGLGNVVTAAMNQAFFTLSLGIAAMEVFGSYMKRDHTLTSEAVRICSLDTFVALMAGLIIFPACFSFGVEPDQGPSLIFMTLPRVFVNMAGGRLWGTLFFLFMTFASFSTVIAVFENLQANCIDNFGWSRRKSAVWNCVFILIASMPCVLGYNVWSGVHLIGGRDVLDSEDFIVSNLLLPLGSLVYLLFCVTKYGWGYDKFLEEANAGEGLKMPRGLKAYFQFILPVLILIILLQGLVPKEWLKQVFG
jgi:NSS family neurotransmitter:Na+ symporter